MSIRKFIAAIIIFSGISAAQATPSQDEIDKLLHQKGLISRLSDTIHHATDRASNLVVNAMGALGVPYRFGGTSAETGFDCSGFVRAMVQQTMGMLLPRSSEQQAAATEQIEKAELKPGDLVFFNTRRRAYSHVGIYVGDEKFIHAPRSGARVRVESMESRYWTTRFNGARRVLSDSSGETMQASSSRVITRESPAPRSVRLGGGFSQPAPTAPLPSLPSAGDSI